MAKQNNGSENSSVNFGLIFAIILLIILTVCIGCYCEPFKNLPTYKIPYIGQDIPSLRGLTVPVFHPDMVTMGSVSPVSPMLSVGPVETEEGQIDVMNQESEKIIKEAQQVIDEEFSNMQQRVEYLRGTRLQRPQVQRVNPRAAPKPRAAPRVTQRPQQRKATR
jgi:hypothetical protein